MFPFSVRTHPQTPHAIYTVYSLILLSIRNYKVSLIFPGQNMIQISMSKPVKPLQKHILDLPTFYLRLKK